MADYRIEAAAPEHVASLSSIERAAARLFDGMELAAIDPDDVTPLAELHEAQRAGQLFVALAGDGAAVGFALVHEHGGAAHLEEVDVHPDHGRRGIGARLVEAVCGFAARRGLREVTLTTFRDVPWNEPFYRRLGFEEIRERDLSDALREIVAEEAEHGLDPERRVAMRRAVAKDGAERTPA